MSRVRKNLIAIAITYRVLGENIASDTAVDQRGIRFGSRTKIRNRRKRFIVNLYYRGRILGDITVFGNDDCRQDRRRNTPRPARV